MSRRRRLRRWARLKRALGAQIRTETGEAGETGETGEDGEVEEVGQEDVSIEFMESIDRDSHVTRRGQQVKCLPVA